MKKFVVFVFALVMFATFTPPSNASKIDTDVKFASLSNELITPVANVVAIADENTNVKNTVNTTNPQTTAAIYESPKYEMRGAWVATVENIDMPGKMNREAFTIWADDTCSYLKKLNFNTVVYQVKPLSDTLYRSELAPFSQYLTGKQGVDPGYDPLDIMLTTAHGYGLELHAWINPYRVTMPNQSLDTLTSSNIAKKYPGWVLKYGSQYYLNPGIPDVRRYLVNSVTELVRNYDIDAVHMDDYFYPYPISGQQYPDDYTYKTYGSQFSSVEDFRRDNVNKLVAEINNAVKTEKQWVQFGISPFGVWRNSSKDSTGSQTKALENYDSLYADTRQWIKDGSIDYIAPQIYWTKQFEIANFSILSNWWNSEITTYAYKHGINLYLGLADYKMGEPTSTDKGWSNINELSSQIVENRSKENISGQIHFSYNSIVRNNLGYADILLSNEYKNKVLNPKTPWNGNTAPPAPSNVSANACAVNGSTWNNAVKIDINDTNTSVRKYVIYRFDQNAINDYNDPKNILDIVYRGQNTVYYDTSALSGKKYTYGVKALSFTNIESDEYKTVQCGL